MNPYLARLRGEKTERGDSEALSKLPKGGFDSFDSEQSSPISRPGPAYAKGLAALEARCPALVEVECWQRAVEDSRRFLAQWGAQAVALGWTARDLFGLHEPPEKPHPSYRRLSRYDETGLPWLRCVRSVVALTENTASIRTKTGGILTYRRSNKPALAPLGDSLEDLR